MIANHTAALKPLTEYAHKAAQAYDRLSIAIRGAHGHMTGVVGAARGLLHTVEHITRAVAKWSAIGAGVGGIGWFGLDTLAGSVAGQARSARGMGLSIGQQSAFNVNQRPYLGSPDAFLSGVAYARQNVTDWWRLTDLGINPYTAQAENPFNLSLQVEARARNLWRRSHGNIALMQAYGVEGLGLSIADLRNLGSMSDQQFAAMQARTRSDVGRLGWTNQQTAEWTQLSIQAHRAGQEIERIFVRGLVPIAPQLERLSQAVVDVIGDFFRTHDVAAGVKHIAAGIEEAASYLGSPKFRADLRFIAADMSYAAHKLVAAGRWLGLLPGGSEKGPTLEEKAKAAGIGAGIGGAVGAVVGHPMIGAALGAAAGVKIENYDHHLAMLGRMGPRVSGRITGLPSQVHGAHLRDWALLQSESAAQHPQDARARLLYREYARLQLAGRDDPALDHVIARTISHWHGPSDAALERLIRVTKGQKRATVDLRISNDTASRVAVQANNLSAQ